MKNFLIKLLYKFLDFQTKVQKNYYDWRYRKFLNKKSVSSKTHITAHETLHLNAEEKLKAKETVDKAKEIFKANLVEPWKIFDHIKEQGTPVFIMPNANRILWLIGEEEGFLIPKNGFFAIILCILINIFAKEKIEIKPQTPPLFIVRSYDWSPYFLAYQLYHWMAFSRNLSGYDPKTVKNFKNIFNLENDALARKKLSIEEILSLREAIARDIEAIDMVVQLALEVSGQKKASDKLKNEGDISV